MFYVAFFLITYVGARFPLFTSIRAEHLWERKSALGVIPYGTFWGNYFAAYFQGSFATRVYNPGDAYLVFWSLCVEEHFYLLWPLALLVLKRHRDRLVLGLAICSFLPLLRFLVLHLQLEANTTVHAVSHYRLDSILWGSVAALAWPWLSQHMRVVRSVAVGAFGGATALSVTAHLSVLPPGSPLGDSLGLSVVALACTAVVIEVASGRTGWLVQALELRPLVFVGRLSYAMYLVHFPAIDLAKLMFFAVPRAPTVPTFVLSSALFVVVTIALSWPLHLAVTWPVQTLKSVFEVQRAEP
jgi:peptidoglycan/LPS O-acetylase OafA/YrhL